MKWLSGFALCLVLAAASFGQVGDFAPTQTASNPLQLRIADGSVGGGVMGTFKFTATNILLTASATNFVYFDLSQSPPVLNVNTTGFPSSQVYKIATVVTNSTQITSLADNRPALNLNLPGSGGGGASINAVYLSQNCGSAPNCFQIKGGVIYYPDASWTSGQNIVTIQNCGTTGGQPNCVDPPFTSNMVGWIMYATNWPPSGTNNGIVEITQGTITSVDSATQVHVSNNASLTCTSSATAGCAFLIGPADDTIVVQNAWAAAVQACVPLILPNANFFISQGILYPTSPTATTGFGQCSAGQSGASSTFGPRGMGVVGQSPFTSMIVVLPSFDANTCDHGPGSFSDSSCIFANRGLNSDSNTMFMNFGIFGGGNEVVPHSAGFNIFQLGDNSIAQNVRLIGWGLDTCIRDFPNPGLAQVLGSTFIDCGNVNLVSSFRPSVISGNLFLGSKAIEVSVQGTTNNNTVISGNVLTNASTVALSVATSAQATETGNVYQSCGTECIDVSGLLNSVGSSVFLGIATADVQVESGGTVRLFDMNAQNGTTFVNNLSGGTFYDGGGNHCASCATQWANAGTWTNSAASSNLVPVTAAKLVLSAGWGSTAANTALSGGDAPIGFTITNSGTGQAASPTITYTFPTPYAVTPTSCSATQTGGTNATGTFTSSALSTTGVTFTFSLTPTASSTEIIQVTCVNP